jgi:5-methylcytosine-specific restriction enzyme subunit McrC
MAVLFEYGDWAAVSGHQALRKKLGQIWLHERPADSEAESENENDPGFQPFLQFDGDRVRANNFVGFVQHNDEVIEIYPKVFRHIPDAHLEKELMLRHIFYWFGYCRKWRFPFNRASLDVIEIDRFPELIINLIANQFLDTVSEQPLTMYQSMEESLGTPRGTLNFGRYIGKSLSHGKFHMLECDHEPFLFDNRVNRIIKYCSRALLGQTRFHENQRVLQEVVFILDEVEDVISITADLDKVSLNPFFEKYTEVMDMCRLILGQNLYSTAAYDLNQWCLLFPMEYIFEDFVAGFLKEKFHKQWKVEYQKSDEHLSNNPQAFQMRHDIFLTARDGTGRKIIVDTKYKLRPLDFKSQKKKGIAQGDLYQMVSYAVKRGCTEVVLLYPNLSEEIDLPDRFEIISGFASRESINITAFEIPFWSWNNFKGLDQKLFHTMENHLSMIGRNNL